MKKILSGIFLCLVLSIGWATDEENVPQAAPTLPITVLLLMDCFHKTINWVIILTPVDWTVVHAGDIKDQTKFEEFIKNNRVRVIHPPAKVCI